MKANTQYQRPDARIVIRVPGPLKAELEKESPTKGFPDLSKYVRDIIEKRKRK